MELLLLVLVEVEEPQMEELSMVQVEVFDQARMLSVGEAFVVMMKVLLHLLDVYHTE